MHHPSYQKALDQCFVSEEAKVIVAFLERSFSPNGETFVANIFIYAKDRGKQLADIFAACTREWEKTWQYQHPDIRGDGDAPGAAGAQNRISLDNIYRALGISSNFEKEGKVSTASMTIKTKYSTYILGQADANDERTISRDKEQLPFTRCRIISLSEEGVMRFIPIGHISKEPWTTSQVESIVVG